MITLKHVVPANLQLFWMQTLLVEQRTGSWANMPRWYTVP